MLQEMKVKRRAPVAATLGDGQVSDQGGTKREDESSKEPELKELKGKEVGIGMKILWHLGITSDSPIRDYVHSGFKTQRDSGIGERKELNDA